VAAWQLCSVSSAARATIRVVRSDARRFGCGSASLRADSVAGHCRNPPCERRRAQRERPRYRRSSVGKARRREPAVVCQQPPVVGSAQFGDRRRSRPRGRRDFCNRGEPGVSGRRKAAARRLRRQLARAGLRIIPAMQPSRRARRDSSVRGKARAGAGAGGVLDRRLSASRLGTVTAIEAIPPGRPRSVECCHRRRPAIADA
jgi:hypothetical protein